MFLCIPIICGPVPHTKPEKGDQHPPQQCPRCRNVSVVPFRRRTWFELYWIPLIPFKVKHLLICTICQWTAINPNGDPSNTDGAKSAQYEQQQQHDLNYPPPSGRGYDVGYHGQGQGAKV
ncbi:hypothetical protein JCM6882_002931 [Rhodosporidiobolus microsporus]